jgi:hypothetical protein
MKETFWSKLRELWVIRRCCQQIKLQQRTQSAFAMPSSRKRSKPLTAGLQKISNQLGMTKPEGDGALWYPLHFFAIPVAFFFWKEAKTTETNK